MIDWWNRLGRGQRIAVAVLGLVVAVNLSLAGLGSLVGGGDPGGPVSSSFSTGGTGLEGFADLLRSAGHPVSRIGRTLTAADLPVGATVVVADPEQLTNAEARALIGFTRGGGRLVLAGGSNERLLAAVTGVPVTWEAGSGGDPLTVWLPVDGVGSAQEVVGAGAGSWLHIGSLVPVAGSGSDPVLLAGRVGRGRVLALADSGPLHNRNLARGDNAALALGLAGDVDRPVVFAESVHGFTGGGLQAVPPSWKWTALGSALALLLGLWWAGSRLGPPEPQRRELRPPRLAHVEAVAADLDRVTAHPADAAAPLRDATRRALAARLGVAPDASPAVLFAGAEQAGIEAHDVALLVSPPADLDAALAVGALAASRQRVAFGVAEPPTGTVPTDPDSRGATL